MRFKFNSLVKQCNVHDRNLYVPLTLPPVDGSSSPVLVGLVRKDRIQRLEPYQHVFDWKFIDQEVRLQAHLNTEPLRTAAMQQVAKALKPETWKNEAYGARCIGSDEPWFRLDRSASTFFGISQFGCHLNGFVRNSSRPGDISVWLATRDASKAIHPGKLDSLVGGGLPWDISPFENMLKEAKEEAGLEREEIENYMISTGSLTYVNDEVHGFKNNTMFIFDLELPSTWKPKNLDGEVAGFHLWPVDAILNKLQTTPSDFKPDICLVLIDFFLRHGILNHGNVGDEYASLCSQLHATPPF